MENIKDYSYSKAKRYSVTFLILGVIGILATIFLMVYFNNSGLIEDENSNMIFIIILVLYLVVFLILPVKFFITTKKALEKLPTNIDEIWKNGTEYKGMENFVLCEEGLLAFIDSKPIYIKYMDMQRAYLYKFTQKVFFIPVTVTYAINIETLEKNYSIPIKKKTDNIKYTEDDFHQLISEFGNRNEHMTLGYI